MYRVTRDFVHCSSCENRSERKKVLKQSNWPMHVSMHEDEVGVTGFRRPPHGGPFPRSTVAALPTAACMNSRVRVLVRFSHFYFDALDNLLNTLRY